jgi:hypothetical protein
MLGALFAQPGKVFTDKQVTQDGLCLVCFGEATAAVASLCPLSNLLAVVVVTISSTQCLSLIMLMGPHFEFSVCLLVVHLSEIPCDSL